MIAHVLKYRKWNKIEMCFAFFLIAVFVSEIAVIFLLGHGSGEALSKTFASMAAMGLSALEQIWKWTYKMVGPMVFPLLMLTGVEIWAIVSLAGGKAKCNSHDLRKQFKALEIVECVAPGFGFLGTCIALIFTMQHMDPNLTQTDMLKAFIDNSSSAFGSTVFGISLAIIAYISSKAFEEFFIKPELHEEQQNNLHQPGRAVPVNLCNKEACDALDTWSH